MSGPRNELEGREVLETCREWMPSRHDNCKAPADFVLWGKLFPPEALGPRCQNHAVKHVPHLLGRVSQYAVLDLRRLRRV